MGLPDRTWGNSYRYGFNGKELDQDEEVVQYDYGFRIYDPRLGRFKSIDPLTKSYPMLTPYQFASNSPIANIDLDGGESKYYTVEFYENYDGNGKLVSSTKRTVEEKSKEAGWHMRGWIPSYTSEGPRGEGTLYSIVSAKTTTRTDGSKDIVVTQIGSIYTPPPLEPSPDRPVSTMPFNIIVYGSSSNADWGLGSKPNPNGKTISFDYASFQALIEPILIGQPEQAPGSLEPKTSSDFIEWLGDEGLEKAVEKMKAKWEQKAKEGKYLPNAEICPTCKNPANAKDHEFINSNTTYLTNKDGDVTDTLKYNPKTNKKDTVPTSTQPKPKGK